MRKESHGILRDPSGRLNRLFLFLLACLSLSASGAAGHELSGFVGMEARLFANSAIHRDQQDQSASLVAQPEYYHEWKGGSSFTFVPFYRLDSADPERTHFDLREMNFLWLAEDFELRAGVGKVFWGVTEVVHLVDIINQTDLVENVDTEDKLGQPMINLSVARDWGTLDLFFLPFFREQTFPGRRGRLRSAATVDTNRTLFESPAKEWNSDWAFRYSHSIEDVDIGLYHFVGTGREPTLLPGTDGDGNPILIPFYEQINQTGLDLSYVAGEWLWKLEALFRAGQGDEDFFSATGGFEYTFTRIFDTAMDVGVLLEGIFDQRGERATTEFEHDIAFGLRWTRNDAASTEALFGWVQDVKTNARFLFLETSRRFGDHWKLNLEIRAFLSQPADDLLFDQRADDLMQLELYYFF
ncbi:MAG: hypothetical protein ACE5E9_12805 [Nitrospinaceae bacterium]